MKPEHKAQIAAAGDDQLAAVVVHLLQQRRMPLHPNVRAINEATLTEVTKERKRRRKQERKQA